MISADYILTNGIVLTMDDAYRVYNPGAVAIRKDSILAVGPADEVTTACSSDHVLDCDGQVILPGLINAHTHVPMTLLRGLADDLRLDVWLLGYMMPTEREFVSPDFVRLGTRLACAEMILAGVTCFADMYYFEHEVAQTTAEVGMRAVCGQTILKFPSPDAASYEESLAACRQFILDWKDHPLIMPAVAPHAPYTCTAEILQACAALAAEFDVPLHTHLSETALEVEDSRRERQMPVIPWVKKQNLFDAKVIAAHCVHVDSGEIHTLLHHGAGVAHNPTSNLKLSSGIAPVSEMLEVGLNVGIGTDGTASNNDLDMLEEMRLAALLAKVATGDPTSLPARQALAMATSMGARALHLGDITGTLEPGKRADLIVVDLRPLHNWPHFQRSPDAVYSQIVYAAKSTDVQHVMCNGVWLMRDRHLLTLEIEALTQAAAEVARRIDTFLIAREGDVYSKLIAIGGVQQEESFEVQVKAQLDRPERVYDLLERPDMHIVRTSHYRQHDAYFLFPEPEQNRVRYREDDFLDPDGNVTSVRARLTLTGPSKEREFAHAILLSRSRFIAPADRPLRFYREYFQPAHERGIVKERRRWHIDYRGARLYVNLDRLTQPQSEGYFLEIKSRTWSKSDAEHKANLIAEVLEHLDIGDEHLVAEEYMDF
jgi:5-methylthioadenosine/S-adenosylhomocysteine deaminase